MRYQWSCVHQRRSYFNWRSKMIRKKWILRLWTWNFFQWSSWSRLLKCETKKNCVRHQIKKVLTISGIWIMSFFTRPSWIYIRKKVGITEIVSDDRLLHFKPSNLISVSPTTPSNDFHVSRSLAKSPLRCSCVVVFELELDLDLLKLDLVDFITS